ncbi:polygalacturonase [Ricinus communis]|uniref:polygalacturonase n=1 Tax=Ricinus communis TaxID=3988 RepID=UPI0007727529|nr:polygalacturonase [Ricinus communis]|eukprot:XP_015580830.1 polygalacturonase [Ricinus communis]
MALPVSTRLVVLAIIFVFVTSSSFATAAIYNVSSYGAKPDGTTDSTEAFIAAWKQACSSLEPTTIYVPLGRFLLRNVAFRGKCRNNAIQIRIDGMLVAPSDYRVIGHSENWLLFENVDGVSFFGGVLDAQGTGLWNCKATAKNCPSGATSLRFTNANNIEIKGLSSLNSQLFHIVLHGCQNVKMEGVKVSAPGQSPNTDGIHVQLSSAITILNSIIGTGDDCVSVGPGTSHLWIENIACGPGHGISIGSLGKEFHEPGVQNVTVKTVTFTGTENGVRIKAWARPSTGFARNISFQNAIMKNVHNPIVIDQNYCPHKRNCPHQGSGIKISNVCYQNIYGTSATEVAMRFDCSKKNPCTGIRLQNVVLTYKNQPADASCTNADGTASGLVNPASCLTV